MKKLLVSLAFLLFSIFVVGLFYFLVTPTEFVSLPLAYAAGLSMIFLPCTLPLAFVIVPMAMRESPKKALVMSLLFGVGLVITITLYGVAAALIGGTFNLQAANIIFITIGGVTAYLFGLSELDLLRVTGPLFGVGIPRTIQQRGDYAKALFMGLLLGNMGVGCPNPAFYVLLSYIAASGSVVVGASLGLVHAIGRATPLLFLAVLGIMGVDSTKTLIQKRSSITHLLGWSLIVVGAVMLLTGGPFKPWYEESAYHETVNDFLLSVSGGRIGEQGEEFVFDVPFVPQFLAPYVFVGLLLLPLALQRTRSKERGVT